MRDSHERRQPHSTSLFPFRDNPLEATGVERRRIFDRRIENLSLEERQLQFCEMPALPPKLD